ncbi:hypothetical protein N7474_008079 [Penicillium riverlandense]|uniref:uncharacterized protein n=1 Tax=Penicillium riverlandense TaxID=1903569 RepID=UPI002546990B|nr:uncharacterized protein N7474_008079 [Penicillium riverlandense]KAJ5811778.1 hypothetical protein N7474_008079 [Penicillium riverlandense]
MRLTWLLIFFFVSVLAPRASAVDYIESDALSVCMESSNFTATYFNVMFYPGNRSLELNFEGFSAVSDFILAEVTLTAYGYKAIQQTIDLCSFLSQHVDLCPMRAGVIKPPVIHIPVPESTIQGIPSIAYTVPDLDASVQAVLYNRETKEKIACVQASLSNGKTVYQEAVAWVTAIICCLGLIASAITSGLGHSNTAAHVAANVLSLFGFMQGQAMIGMTSVHMPPIVESWTQNFQWSIGIIHVDFLDTICTWYQRSTGGTPTALLSELSTTSVEILRRRKRDLLDPVIEPAVKFLKRATTYLTKRESSGTQKLVVVRGISRVGFRANIEETNVFLTGLIFFFVFVLLVMIIVISFTGICELLVRYGKIKSDNFQEFRKSWKVVLRGILFRLSLIGFPQMCLLCMWEFIQRDSPAEVVLAAVMFLSLFVSLSWASQKVIRLAKRSIMLHKNPAYILYSDPTYVNKWGFLYVQYRATAYYFIVLVLVYILAKGMFIGLSQPDPIVQSVALVILEAAMLVSVSILRPWMDKKTNIFNITIAAVNFLNASFLLVFSDVFNPPGMATGIMGVIFFVYNAVFALVLIILVLIAAGYAIFSKYPDTRYQPMRDDRGSFIKTHTNLNLNTELDALGVTARNEPKGGHEQHSQFENDRASISSGDCNSVHPNYAPQPSASPIDPSTSLFPSSRGASPNYDHFRGIPTSSGACDGPVGASALTTTYRSQNNSSPWQRGAGYDH